MSQVNQEGNSALILGAINNHEKAIYYFNKLTSKLLPEEKQRLFLQVSRDGKTAQQIAAKHFVDEVEKKSVSKRDIFKLLKTQLSDSCDKTSELEKISDLLVKTIGESTAEKARGLWIEDPSLRRILLEQSTSASKAYRALVEESDLPPSTIELLCKGEKPPLWCFPSSSLCLLSSQESIETMKSYLSESYIKITFGKKSSDPLNPATFFDSVLSLRPAAGTRVTKISPIVGGDLDGSTTRMTLLGLQAGMISLTERGCRLLVDMMCGESAANHQYLSFQQDKRMRTNLDDLLKEIAFHPGQRPLILLGDCAHDRLSCNKDVDRVIREWLKASGAIFVLGNHDTVRAWQNCTSELYPDIRDRLAWGAFAQDTGDEETWENHTNYVFVRAYWDNKGRTLYTHNGVAFTYPQVQTAFGSIDVFPLGPEELTKRINTMPFTTISFKDPFTKFRPSSHCLTALAELASYYSIRQVHGHDGDRYRINNDVYGLNSRYKGDMSITAVLMGEKD